MEEKMVTIAIVGRPNVGKSTLFNRLVGFRKAIVIDQPGATRDRNYATAQWNGRSFFLVDTGGFEPAATDGMLVQMRQQTTIAIEEADAIIFLMDCRASLLPADREIANILRAVAKPTFFVVNKVDGPALEKLALDFYQLGVENLHTISALQGYGVGDLLDEIMVRVLPVREGDADVPSDADKDAVEVSNQRISIAFVGKPNAGKSSVINKILGHERLIVNQQPGTTRDAIDTMVVVAGKEYLLVDTAGIRRKSRLSLTLEKYSVLHAISAVRRCDVVVLMLDASEGVTEQDAKIAGIISETGKGCIIAVNKWDTVAKDERTVGVYVEKIRDGLKFIDYAPILFISALTGQRVSKLFDAVRLVYGEYSKRVATSSLNEIGKEFLARKAPPRYRGIENTFFYMTQVSVKPPTFVFFVREPQKIHFSYERYITNRLREYLGYSNSPVKVIFRKRGAK